MICQNGLGAEASSRGGRTCFHDTRILPGKVENWGARAWGRGGPGRACPGYNLVWTLLAGSGHRRSCRTAGLQTRRSQARAWGSVAVVLLDFVQDLLQWVGYTGEAVTC